MTDPDRSGDERTPIPCEWAWLTEVESHVERVARVLEGDPLKLVERCASTLRARAVLVDPDRLAARTGVAVAYWARSRDGAQSFDDWLNQCVDEAIEQILAEDRENDRKGAPAEASDAHEFLTRTLRYDPVLARRASVAFNSLEPAVRQAYFWLLIEGRTAEEWEAHGRGSADDVIKKALVALNVLIAEPIARNAAEKTKKGRAR